MPEPKDHDRIITLEAEVHHLHEDVRLIRDDISKLAIAIDALRGHALKLVLGALTVVSFVLAVLWQVENKYIRDKIEEALATNIIQVARQQATSAAADAHSSATNAVHDAARIRRILSEMENHRWTQGRAAFVWDPAKKRYANTETNYTNSKKTVFYSEIKITNSFSQPPNVILTVVDVEQTVPEKAVKYRWDVEPINISTNGFRIRLTQWGAERVETLGVRWNAVEWPGTSQ